MKLYFYVLPFYRDKSCPKYSFSVLVMIKTLDSILGWLS